MTRTILILPGDGIGPEIVAEAAKVLECLCQEHGLDVTLEYGWLGGGAVDELGVFMMSEQGLVPVANPSALFLAARVSLALATARRTRLYVLV